jgi:hypothetical protein
MASISSFVGYVSEPNLIHRLLQRRSIPLSLEACSGKARAVAKAIDEELPKLPPGTRGLLIYDIETVDRMSNEAGESAINSATLHEHLGELPSLHARALWLYLNDPEGFRRAEESAFSDLGRYGKQWTTFAGEKGRDLLNDPAAQEAFKKALRGYFETPNVHLEIFERSRHRFTGVEIEAGDDVQTNPVNLVQITIYREDRPNLEPGFTNGQFGMISRRPVVEAAITYERDSGRIECVAKDKGVRSEVVRHFAEAALGCDPQSLPREFPNYDLTVLANRQRFETDAEDQIETVDLAMLRLNPVDGASERVILERSVGGSRDIWHVAEERLKPNALSTEYFISQARLVVKFRERGSNRRQTLNVMITHPFRSNIKEQRSIERVLIAKYLPRWGLVRSQ